MQIKNIIQIYHKIKVIIFITLLIPLFWFGIKAGWVRADSDFPNYYVSAKLLLEGKLNSAYNVQLFNDAIKKNNANAQGLFVMYPPSTALIVMPLTIFDLLNAKRIWIIISLIALTGIIYFISKLIQISYIDAANIILLSGFNLYNDLMLGQVYLVMLFLLLFGWYTFIKKKIFYAGISWGLLAVFKFLPLFFIPFLLLKKQFKLFFFIVISFILINLITYIASDSETYISFLEVFKTNYIEGKVANEIPLSIQYQSIEVISNISVQQYAWPQWTSAIIKLGWKLLWLIFFAGIFIKFYTSKQLLTFSISGIILLLLLFENGSATYHLLFGLFPLIVYLACSTNTNWKKILLCSYATMGFIPILVNHFELSNFIFSFSRLWCLSLFAACFFIGLKKDNTFLK